MCTIKSLYFFKIIRAYNYLEYIYTIYYVYNVDGYFGHIIEVPCQMLLNVKIDEIHCFVLSASYMSTILHENLVICDAATFVA